jgi:hypothetical protein
MKSKIRIYFLILMLLSMMSLPAAHATGTDNAPKTNESTHVLMQHVARGGSFMTELIAENYAEAHVSVSNAAGKLMIDHAVVLDPGKNVLRFAISEIPKGAYFVQVKSQYGTEKMTFVVR